MLVGMILAAWFVVALLMLVAWARFHAMKRAADGIDEALYINGKDEASLAEASPPEAA
jgi:hypothetical protein